MSKKILTLMFFSILVLVVLLYVRIEREKKNKIFEASAASEPVLQEPFEKGESPERIIEQAIAESGAMEQIKGKLESIILDEIIPQYGKAVNSVIECLMKIAEDDIAVFPSDGLVEQSAGKSSPDYTKCISNGALGEVPGDRVEFDLHFFGGKTSSFAIEGGDICKSHSNPSVVAQYALGTVYYFGRVVPQDYAKASNWYMKASQNGFPLADNNLGVMYSKGYGVTQSYKEAFGFYRKAADQGLSIAQNNLGDMYFSGRYVEQNYTEAIKWYRKAAERNSSDAQYTLGYFYADQDRLKYNFNEAFKWFRKAAENGHMFSQTRLGNMFQLGQGTEQNHAKAVKCYLAAADQGDPEAMAFLGYLYEHGLGVSQDTIIAKDLYLAAAQKANAESLFFMGVGWEFYDSQPNDNAMAYIWYRLAAHKGKKEGKKSRSRLSKKMTAAQINRVEEISRQLIEKQ